MFLLRSVISKSCLGQLGFFQDFATSCMFRKDVPRPDKKKNKRSRRDAVRWYKVQGSFAWLKRRYESIREGKFFFLFQQRNQVSHESFNTLSERRWLTKNIRPDTFLDFLQIELHVNNPEAEQTNAGYLGTVSEFPLPHTHTHTKQLRKQTIFRV